MAFSFNGQYFVALGDLPNYTVTLWDWRTKEMLCQCSNGAAASFVSFNPTDPLVMCTSGREDGLQFWTLHEGYKKRELRCT
jgi:WD40 repeat protein